MKWFEPLIIIALIAFVGAVIFFYFYNKKKGKSSCPSCSGSCSSCEHKCTSCKQMLDEYHKQYENN